MTKEEAIKIVRENMHLSYDKGNIIEALKTLIPELAESEDERIRKEISNLPYTDNELNEAAEEFAEAEWDGLHDNDGNPLYTEDYIQYTFKAGVEWAKKHQ